MKKTVILLSLIAAAWALTAAAADQPPKPAASLEQIQQADEQAVRRLADAFTAAYNAGDAKAVAALFVPRGEIVNQAGEIVQGQPAVERAFDEFFKTHPRAKIAVSNRSIRLLSPATAVEDGFSTVTSPAGEKIERNRYLVVHVKQDGTWRMADARDLPDERNSPADELQGLQWIIGDWVDENADGSVLTSYRWADDGRAILGDFQVRSAGRPAMTGTQRIGWDPLAKKPHSWVYDSEGGFAEGVWTRSGDQWTVKMTGVTSDGLPSSSTNVIGRVTKDRMTWQSRDRVIGDELMPNIAPVVIVRKPPKPH